MKKIILVLVLLLSIIAAVGCTTKKINNDFQEILDKNNYIIVDVRTKEEYDTGHIKDSINIPVDDIESRINELDKNKTILVYCRSGRRSTTAYNILKDKGYKSYNLGAYESITKFEKGA